MARHPGLALAEDLGQLGDRQLTVAQKPDNPDPGRLAGRAQYTQ